MPRPALQLAKILLVSTLIASCAGSAPEPAQPAPQAEPSAAVTAAPTPPAPAPRAYGFLDPARRKKLAGAFVGIDQALAKRAQEAKVPGYAFGLVIDGELAHVFTYGVADRTTGAPVTAETRFRVGSLSKTFTALALAKLRDDGKLASLDEPLESLLPEAAALRHQTRDAGPVRLREMLLHTSGLLRTGDYDERYRDPVSRATLIASLSLPLLSPPHESYYYSNFAYGLLGLAVEGASGSSYRDYLRQEIFTPLGLESAAWSSQEVPLAHRARSYDKTDDSEQAEWQLGALDASGGLFLNVRDLARWIAFHAEAFPARDELDRGPVRRATVRELLSTGNAEPPNEQQRVFVHTALGWDSSSHCGERIVWKSGRVEGFLTLTLFMPDHGVGLVSMSNMPMSLYGAHGDVLAALAATGGLTRRELSPSPELLRAAAGWVEVFNDFQSARFESVYGTSFRTLVSESAAGEWTRKQRARVGACELGPVLRVENALAGRVEIRCQRATAQVTLGLTPDGAQIASSFNQWTFSPTDAQTAEARALLAGLGRGKPVLHSSASAELKSSAAEVSKSLRALGSCVEDAPTTTSSSVEVALRVRCKGEARRVLRLTFAEDEPARVTRLALEQEPPPAPVCKSW